MWQSGKNLVAEKNAKKRFSVTKSGPISRLGVSQPIEARFSVLSCSATCPSWESNVWEQSVQPNFRNLPKIGFLVTDSVKRDPSPQKAIFGSIKIGFSIPNGVLSFPQSKCKEYDLKRWWLDWEISINYPIITHWQEVLKSGNRLIQHETEIMIINSKVI